MKTIPAEKSKEAPTLTSASYEELMREVLVRLGEDPAREGLASTPAQGNEISDQGLSGGS